MCLHGQTQTGGSSSLALSTRRGHASSRTCRFPSAPAHSGPAAATASRTPAAGQRGSAAPFAMRSGRGAIWRRGHGRSVCPRELESRFLKRKRSGLLAAHPSPCISPPSPVDPSRPLSPSLPSPPMLLSSLLPFSPSPLSSLTSPSPPSHQPEGGRRVDWHPAVHQPRADRLPNLANNPSVHQLLGAQTLADAAASVVHTWPLAPASDSATHSELWTACESSSIAGTQCHIC